MTEKYIYLGMIKLNIHISLLLIKYVVGCLKSATLLGIYNRRHRNK
jgi:hypothetical protein